MALNDLVSERTFSKARLKLQYHLHITPFEKATLYLGKTQDQHLGVLEAEKGKESLYFVKVWDQPPKLGAPEFFKQVGEMIPCEVAAEKLNYTIAYLVNGNSKAAHQK